MKILVIQQKMIGDVLTTSILFEVLKEKYPNAKLHYLINSHTLPVVEHNPFIDKFVFFTPEIEKSKTKLIAFAKEIRKEQYNAVVDVYGKLSSFLISLFSKAKIKTGFYKSYSSLIYSHPIKRKSQPNYNASLAIENRMLLLEPLEVPFKNIKPKIYLKQTEIDDAKIFLESHEINLSKPLLMISVLGSSIEKTYPFEYMSKLLDSLVDKVEDAQILFNYIPKQKNDAKAIYDACLSNTQSKIYFDVYGKSLSEFLAITHYCNALIGNEGGANNMAKALDVNTFTIFSPYLNKQNWFGETEKQKHVALHLSDYIEYSAEDKIKAKASPKDYYLKFKPEYLIPQLNMFLDTLAQCNTSF
jgi:heptosyltransferase-2